MPYNSMLVLNASVLQNRSGVVLAIERQIRYTYPVCVGICEAYATYASG